MSSDNKDRQNEKQSAAPAPALTRQQMDRLGQLAKKEIMNTPGYKSWSAPQRAEAVAKRMHEMARSPHYQALVGGFKQSPASSDQESPDSSKPEKREGSFDLKRFAGMSPADIAQELLKIGLVKEATDPGTGLQIVGTSRRFPHEYEGS